MMSAEIYIFSQGVRRNFGRSQRAQIIPFHLKTSSMIAASRDLTALVHSANSPFPERALHLKSFGAQAALVAGSPYYQMLVGVILGYDTRHVESHVSEKGGVLTQAITADTLTIEMAVETRIAADTRCGAMP